MADFPFDQVLQALLKNRMSPILYEASHTKIRRVLAHQWQKPDDHPNVEDCLQETFLGVYKALNNKSDEELINLAPGLEKYLYETASHARIKFLEKNSTCIRVRRGKKSGGEETIVFVVPLDQPDDSSVQDIIDEKAENPERIAIMVENAREMSEEVEIVLAALPQQYKEVLTLRYLVSDDPQPLGSIATQVAKSEGAIKADLSRARQLAINYVYAKHYLQKKSQEGKEDVSTLHIRCRRVVLCLFYENLSWEKIAVECNCTEEQAKKTLHRGIHLLLRYWKAPYEKRG